MYGHILSVLESKEALVLRRKAVHLARSKYQQSVFLCRDSPGAVYNPKLPKQTRNVTESARALSVTTQVSRGCDSRFHMLAGQLWLSKTFDCTNLAV